MKTKNKNGNKNQEVTTMRKSGIKAVIIATALAMTVPTIATTTVTAKKKQRKQ